MAALKDYLPFTQAPKRSARRVAVIDDGDSSPIAKLFKAVSLALGFSGASVHTRANFEESPYDFDRILQAIDTDSYVKQGFNKYRELLWKEGWDLVGENDEAVDYVRERIDFMEYAMRRPFDDLLSDIGDQLVKFGNCFVAKARGNLAPIFPGPLNPPGDKQPVVGYYIVPAETVVIKRDKHNKVKRYYQKIDSIVTGYNTQRQPSWKPDEMIHFYVDRKPGRAFGTPFIISALDDVIALRQMEEDVQNLVHKELFPLYKYQVGTDEHPAEPEEIDAAAQELANLRTDGGLVLPDRHDVEVIGSNENALDATGYIQHFLSRVCVGLGLSPHHLGIMSEGGNRSVTDRLDIALYDKVKTFQRYLSDMIRLTILSELLLEGGFDPITHPLNTGVSDRCEFRFREIDVDTQVKKEAHTIQKFTSNLIELPEARLELGLDPDVTEEALQAAVTARLTPQQTKNLDGTTTVDVPNKPDAATPSTGGRANPPNNRKGSGNIVRPSNQHGRRTSPNIRHDDDWVNKIVELIDDSEEL